MKNDFEIRGDVTAIFIKRRNGHTYETLIDTEDLGKVQKYTWRVVSNPKKRRYYAMGVFQANGQRVDVLLHRLVMNAPNNLQVDHINHETLDNRKINLRLVTNAENKQNQKGARRDNKTSGIRGVSWDKKSNKWRAYLMVNGKQKYLGLFTEISDAEMTAKNARAKLMPYSKEASQLKIGKGD